MALLNFMAANGVDVSTISWVVGVRLKPMSAHCWLQSGELVINDTPEYTRVFNPLIVVPGRQRVM
jgi:hypothetical protein